MAKETSSDGDDFGSQDNVFNMGMESLKILRLKMNQYYFWSENDEPIKARGCLEAIYAEAHSDFTDDEKKECVEKIAEIARLVVDHNNEQTVFQSNHARNKNASAAKHIKTKGKLLSELRLFYMQLIVCLDKHDMLRPKKDDPRFAVYN